MSPRCQLLTAISVTAALAFAGVQIPAASAHKGAKGIVKERMDAMKSIGDNMKSIKKMLAGEKPYDAAQVKKSAGVIKSRAGDAMVKLFPKGSLQKPTEATPKIWEEWDGFKEGAMRLRDYAAVLEETADRDGGAAEASGMAASIQISDIGEGGWPSPAELKQMPRQAIFMAVGKTCKSCHESYRVKKEENGHDAHKGHGH